MKTGILGGTFDPVHNGHMVVADAVKDVFGLDEVIFIPAGRPWLKASTAILPAEQRLCMLRLAVAGKASLKLSSVEIDRAGPSYSVDTLAEMQRETGSGDGLYFIVGMDSLAQLPRWHQPHRLIELCHLVSVPRVGYPAPDLASLEEAIPGITQRLIILDKPKIDISASDIRQRVREGLPIDRLVPKAVGEYIKEHSLYRE